MGFKARMASPMPAPFRCLCTMIPNLWLLDWALNQESRICEARMISLAARLATFENRSYEFASASRFGGDVGQVT